jgi:hypothetical protein
MSSRKELRPEAGSLEAALRELNPAAAPDDPMSPHPELASHLRPGEHTTASPRSMSVENARPEEGQDVTLWGRCGYVPASRTRSA